MSLRFHSACRCRGITTEIGRRHGNFSENLEDEREQGSAVERRSNAFRTIAIQIIEKGIFQRNLVKDHVARRIRHPFAGSHGMQIYFPQRGNRLASHFASPAAAGEPGQFVNVRKSSPGRAGTTPYLAGNQRKQSETWVSNGKIKS
jgi:hypothetical protein